MAAGGGNAGAGGGQGNLWPATIVALAFIGLVGVMFWRASYSSNFSTIWAGVGTVVGVITGAIPSFFFARTANTATNQAHIATQEANRRADQVAAFYAVTDDNVQQNARMRNPAAFP
jgi:uncharacterized membrane protein YdjX (TVP38/TMEM64 family)